LRNIKLTIVLYLIDKQVFGFCKSIDIGKINLYYYGWLRDKIGYSFLYKLVFFASGLLFFEPRIFDK